MLAVFLFTGLALNMIVRMIVQVYDGRVDVSLRSVPTAGLSEHDDFVLVNVYQHKRKIK